MTSVAALFSYVFAHDTSPEESRGVRSAHSTDTSATNAGIPLVDPADAALTVRLRAGEEAAVNDLVAIYAEPLTRFASVLTGSFDVAEGLVYDVLADVWEHRARLRPDRSLKTYLFTALRRRAADLAARERVRDRHADIVRAIPPDDIHNPSPEDVLSAREAALSFDAKLHALYRAIATLSDRRRLALHLRFEQGLSYPALGEVLGLSDKGARQLVVRALDTLRHMLGT